jgi:deoxyribodipyrimidine photolyase-related protein
MSDYCKGCHYDHNAKTGDKSCPFNSLYWNFLIQKRPLLNDNNRMKMMFSLLDKKSPNEVEFIQDRARDIIQHPDRY